MEYRQKVLRQRQPVHEDLRRKQGSNRRKPEFDLPRTGFNHTIRRRGHGGRNKPNHHQRRPAGLRRYPARRTD